MDEDTFLTCKKAAEILGFTQRHIANLIKKGRISAGKDINGKYFIDKSEFYRVFPDAMPVERKENSMETASIKFLEEKVELMEQLMKQKDTYNEFLREQLQNSNIKEMKLLDALGSNSRLLEHQNESTQHQKNFDEKTIFSRIFKKK